MRRYDGVDLEVPPRFEPVRKLGAGATGVVYEVRDRDSGQRLALKLFDGSTAADAAAVKAEFRVVRDLRHPNLASVGELFEHAGRWSYTMELVDGDDIVTWFAAIRHEVDALVRLCLVMRGLAETLLVLHRSDLLHLDIKPLNVLVTSSDRVVLIDYGLIAGRGVDSEGQLVGTLPYVAPERIAGSLGVSADWYAFGALLYQLLAGQPAFRGAGEQIHAAKLRGPASEPLASIPADLASLALSLLAPTPGSRPDGKTVLSQLGGVIGATSVGITLPRAPSELALAALGGELDDDTSCVVLVGPAGAGKRATITRWLASLDPDDIVLRTAARSRERTAFHGLGGFVDVLVDHLDRLSFAAQAEVLPDGVRDAARVFPAFERLELVRRGVVGESISVDSLRDAAGRALASIIAALARTTRIVIVLENLQRWDRDAMAVLEVLAAWLPVTNVKLVMSVREDRDRELGLTTLLDDVEIPHRLVTLGSNDRTVSRTDALDTVSPTARRLLDVLSVSVVALTAEVACDVAQVPPEHRTAVLAELVDHGLVTSSDTALVPVSPRTIADKIVPQMVSDWRHRIANALDEADADPLVRVYAHTATNRPERTIAIAREAGDRALSRGAAELATELYQLAVSAGDRTAMTHERLAHVARLAGRMHTVARVSLALSHDSDRAQSLRRTASIALLQAGDIDQGLFILRETDGLALPVRRTTILASLAYARLVRLPLTRAATRTRSDGGKREHVDTLWAAAGALGMTDTLRGALVQTRGLVAALELGEPAALSRAMCSEAAFRASSLPARSKIEALLARGESLAEDANDPHARAWAVACRSLSALMYGDWQVAIDHARKSAAMFGRVDAAHWEQTTLGHALIAALYFRGDFDELSSTVKQLLAASRRRGDRFGETAARISSIPLLLARGALDVAARQLELAHATWPPGNVQSAFIAIHRAQLRLAHGDGDGALAIADAATEELDSRLLLRVPLVRIPLREVTARAAIVSARIRSSALRRAEREIGRLESEPLAWPRALARMYRGCVAAMRGQSALALEHHDAAAAQLDTLDMPMHAAFARARAGREPGWHAARFSTWAALVAIYAP
jgi:Protein kinase domain/AAA ATPase domain